MVAIIMWYFYSYLYFWPRPREISLGLSLDLKTVLDLGLSALALRFWPHLTSLTVWLGLTCVGCQVTLCDPIWQVTLCSCEMYFLVL